MTLQRIDIYLSQATSRYIDKIQMENLSYTATKPPSLLRKVAGFAVTVALVGLVLMFSALLFMAILIAGTIAWGYLWWRTRDLRKQMRKHPSGGMNMESEVIRGEVIEGEVIRVADSGYRDER
ncbi:MAG: hypothetical protein Q8O58_01805 [Gallionella sp.]|nr:hypothetical protein [Gallionella sp.]